MIINGTNGPDSLVGTEEADLIKGLAGNDIVDGLGGNDVIFGGLGADTLSGGEGDDVFVQTEAVTPGDRFSGGNGYDTIELRGFALPVPTASGPTSTHGLTQATLSSIERLVFASVPGELNIAQILYGQLLSSGVTKVVGGAGRETLAVIATGGGSFTMPSLSLENWSTAPEVAWGYTGDILLLGAAGGANLAYTLSAAQGVDALQSLMGQAGSDILIGSDNADLLNGAAGVNQLYGNGGNDALGIINTRLTFLSNGVLSYSAPTLFDGAGSIFDGGEGTDLLSVGGAVNFVGTLVDMDGINLLPAFYSSVPGVGSQDEAYLEMSLEQFAALPADALFRGTGIIDPNLGLGDSFDFSGYRIEPGSQLLFVFDGESDGSSDGSVVTWVGTSNGDMFDFGVDITIATGGGGADIFQVEFGPEDEVQATITDFTPGVDKIDLREEGITGEQRLRDFLSQVGDDVVFEASSGGGTTRIVLQNLLLSNLAEEDFLLLDPDYAINDIGTPLDDLMFGGTGNDVLRGGDGDDRIYGGGGVDQLFGEGGNDRLILDGLVGPGGIYNGGSGTDILELRAAGHNLVNRGGSFSNYALANGNPASFAGIETIAFGSDEETGVFVSLLLSNISGGGVRELVGGVGNDVLVAVAFSGVGGTFTMPSFILTDWTTADETYRLPPGDALILTAAGAGDFTLNAREGLSANQALTGVGGNDILNGSSGNDSLNGGGGVNQLYGKGGDDTLAIVNGRALNLVNGVLVSAPLTFFDGAGSIFDGGAGTDVLSIGGAVDFKGTLIGIEGVYLQPAFTATTPGAATQDEAVLEMSLDRFAALAGDAFFRGVGLVDPDLGQGDSFDFSHYRVEEGVTFLFDGESDGPGVAASWIGTSNGDIFEFGSDTVTATGGGGADSFAPGNGEAIVIDFAVGVDKVDLLDSGITGEQRLRDFLRQVGDDVVFEVSSGGETSRLVLRNVSLADLNEEDFLLPDPDFAINALGTSLEDLTFGGTGNDVIRGGDGGDRIYGGGGSDQLYGEAGNDRLILDALVAPGGIYDGGSGTDVLELRASGHNLVNRGGSFSSYALVNGNLASFSGIETIAFGSDDETGVLVSLLMSNIASSGVTELIGGAGNDVLVALAFSGMGGTFTMPSFTLSNWTTAGESYRMPPGDALILTAAGAGNFTLNAREGLIANQALTGAGGNDMLNGSSGSDTLNGAGGMNQLYGNDGDDTLVIANGRALNLVNGVPVSAPLTTFDGAGSIFDGGAGMDVLSIGGTVNFVGALAGIEGVYLQPAFTATTPGAATQDEAVLVIGGDVLSDLPDDLWLGGTGTLRILVDEGSAYDGSAFLVDDGSAVLVDLSFGVGDDIVLLGAAREMLADTGGIDTAVFARSSSLYGAAAGADGALLIGNDSLKGFEYFRFADGTFYWNGAQLVSAENEGTVADGYIAGARIFIDVDRDGAFDEDEPFTFSGPTGSYSLISAASGPLRAVGGTNIDTGLANMLTLSAPGGAGVINPLTTLIQTIVEASPGTSVAEAQGQVASAFGLDPALQLTQVDLIASGEVAAQKAAATVAEIVGAVVENGGGQGDALGALAELVDDGGAVDLAAAEVIAAVLESGLPGQDVSALVEETQAVTLAIAAAETLEEISQVQANQAPIASPRLDTVREDASVAGSLSGSVSDPEGDPVVVTSVNGTPVTADGLTLRSSLGTLRISADGSYAYAADGDAVDAYGPGTRLTDSFSYTVNDGNGGIARSTITIEIVTIDDLRTVTLGNGRSNLQGTSADEAILGGRGDDALRGGGGADRIDGGQGADLLHGEGGFDLLRGGQGNDRLYGGSGDDLLVGGKGSDLLFGEGGADLFHFQELGDGERDLIGDFEVGVDTIHLGAGTRFLWQDEVGNATVLNFSGGGSITLVGVTGLTSADPLFASGLPDWSAGLPLV